VNWGFSGSAGALSRHDYPSFRTSSEVPRADFHPRVSLPLHFDGWAFRPEAGLRETWYGKSQFPASLEQIPVLRSNGTSRNDLEAGFELRPPAVEGDFAAPWLEHLLGGSLRHTIEPALSYRYVTGINNFRQILRFDQTDVASNTNEMEYGLTQRLFLRHLPPHPCKGDEALGPNPLCGGGTRDWISWRVAQKYYFEPDFDGAITPATPNPLETTLDFTGVDFLTGPRHTTPVISRLRMRTTSTTDAEWDLDYDVKEGRITSSNVFAAYQHGYYRFQFGDSFMNVPLGVTPLKTNPVSAATLNQPSQFNQIHLVAVYGAANKLGLSAGTNAAYDLVHQQLQYGALQGSYNWNCCGLMFQYRRFSLGSIRDDTEYFYSLSLAGISSVGDLRRRISLF
jgi:LPS-assembly protein